MRRFVTCVFLLEHILPKDLGKRSSERARRRGDIFSNRYFGYRFLRLEVAEILSTCHMMTSFPIRYTTWSGSVAKLLATFKVFFLPNLKNDGVPFQAWHIFEDEIDDFQEFVPLQKTGSILIEVIQEVVEDKVGPCNTRNTHFVSLTHKCIDHTQMNLSLTNVSITYKWMDQTQMYRSNTNVSITHKLIDHTQMYRSHTNESITHKWMDQTQMYRSNTNVSITHKWIDHTQMNGSNTNVSIKHKWIDHTQINRSHTKVSITNKGIDHTRMCRSHTNSSWSLCPSF